MQLHSSFNKRTAILSMERLPNYCQTVTKHVQLSGDSATGESTNQRADTNVCRK